MPAEKSEPKLDVAELLKRVVGELPPCDREGGVILTSDDPAGVGFILITPGGMELLGMSVSP